MYDVEVNHKGTESQPAHGRVARSGPFATRDEAERFARSVAGSTPIWSAAIIELEPDAEGEAGAA